MNVLLLYKSLFFCSFQKLLLSSTTMELVNFDGFCRGETYLPPPAHVSVLQASGLRRVDGGYGNEFGFDNLPR